MISHTIPDIAYWTGSGPAWRLNDESSFLTQPVMISRIGQRPTGRFREDCIGIPCQIKNLDSLLRKVRTVPWVGIVCTRTQNPLKVIDEHRAPL